MAQNAPRTTPSTGDAPTAEYGMLVGVDGSDGSRHALEWAAARINRFGSIQPMIVWHTPWWAYLSPVLPPMHEFKKEALRQAAAAVDSVPKADVMAPIVCSGRPGPTLTEGGAMAGLVVLGTRGRSGQKDAMLGSVSSYVVAHSTTPVAVVAPGAPIEPGKRKVLVGVDGSANSVDALRWAIRNTPSDVTIDVVHSWVYPTAAATEIGLELRDVYEDNARHTLNQTVEQAATSLEPENRARLISRLEYGDPRHVLHECGADYDLLVLGARGRGGVAHLLLGSVTSALVHQPAVTTVTVPQVSDRY